MLNEDDTRRTIEITDLQELIMPGEVSFSADAMMIVYVKTKTIITENQQRSYIVVADVQTGDELKEWEGYSPRWSPVSNEIAYMAGHEGAAYIWIFQWDTGIKKPLAPVYESEYFMGHMVQKNFAWSPDGSQIAYISTGLYDEDASEQHVRVTDRLLFKTKGGRGRTAVTDDRLSHIWLVSVETAGTRQLTFGSYNEHSLCWSPDSTRIAFISNRTEDPDNNQLHDLWSIGLSSGITERHTLNIGTAHQPAWSPDGRHIAFLATRSLASTNDSPAEDTHLYVMDLEINAYRCLTKSLDRRIEQLQWHPDKDRVFFTAGDKGATSIYSVSLHSNEIRLVAGNQNHILEYHINKRGDAICYIKTDSTNPSEIFLLDTGTGVEKVFTSLNTSFLHKYRLQPSETYWFESFDGTPVQGWLVKPAGFINSQQYPLLLVIHGGPHNMFGYEFDERVQVLAAKGYGVLFINPRGSTGYGQAFSSGCVLNWGGGDYRDLMAGLDAAILNNQWIDPERLGVTGQSYGGYMTNWIITQTTRFKAAVVDGGISNLVSFAGTSLYSSLIESEFNGIAYDNFPLLWQWSPLRNARNVTTPTLFLHGETDKEVPVTQAEEMYTALKKLGVESRMVQYIGEGHGWRPDLLPVNRYDLLGRTIDWFGRYL